MPVRLNSTGGGSVTIDVPSTAGTFSLNLPASNGSLLTTEANPTIQFVAGSAAAPSVTTLGDTNTGMFFPEADTIAFTEGGVEGMRLAANGNVGIATSSPSQRLDVIGNGRASGSWAVGDSTTAFSGMMTNESDVSKSVTFSADPGAVGAGSFMRFNVDGTERLRIAAAGQIGIGGTNYGTSGQVLTSGGASAAPSWATVSASGQLLNVQVFTSSGTYTRTAGATRAVVIAVGGGGGGGGWRIGAGGTPSTAGGTGGTTSFGSHVTAVGGSGGGGTQNVGNLGGAGGSGGTGSLISIRGAPGGNGTAAGNVTSPANGGGQGAGRGGDQRTGVLGGGGGAAAGGDGYGNQAAGGGGGQGETAIDYITSGLNATETVTIGLGGSAGSGGTGGIAGGAGGAGYIIVYEYT